MAKEEDVYIRARCAPELKKRVAEFIRRKKRPGTIYKEADLIRQAVIEFMDRHESSEIIERNPTDTGSGSDIPGLSPKNGL